MDINPNSTDFILREMTMDRECCDSCGEIVPTCDLYTDDACRVVCSWCLRRGEEEGAL